MSTLTKICVVVQTLLILVACPVFISLATVAPRYRDLYKGKTLENAALAQQVQHTNMALQLARQESSRQKALADKALADKRVRIAELLADKAALEITYADKQASLEGVQADLQIELAINKDVNARYDRQAARNAENRKKINGLMTGAHRLDMLLQEARAQLQRANMVSRVQEEKIAALELEKEDLKIKLASKGSSSSPGAAGSMPVPELMGTILAVREGVASINVGSARGVRRGMKMVVHRGEMLVGYLRIDEVSAQEAAGVIIDNKVPAAAGDKVFTQKRGA